MDAVEEGEGVRAARQKQNGSRFKQDRMARAFGAMTLAQEKKEKARAPQPDTMDEDEAADLAGHDLVHMLEGL